MRMPKATILTIVMLILSTSFLFFNAETNSAQNDDPAESARESRALTFTEISANLPTEGDFNYIALGDFNNDAEIDFAFGGENYGGGSVLGLYAYTGDGGTSWTEASAGLATENSWGGLQLADADGDSYMELYATDEHWGQSSNEGLKVYEYRDSAWTDAVQHVSTPLPTGQPDNVIITDVTSDDKPDMVLCRKNGLKYYENSGGTIISWVDKSTGLATSGEFTAAAVADMNGDDLKDILACDYSGNEFMYIQDAGGSDLWSNHGNDLTTKGITMGVAVGDVNGDSHLDVLYGTRDKGLHCWLGDSGGGSGGTAFTWTESNTGLATNGRYAQIQLVDIDGDSDLDLIAPEGNMGRGIEIYLGNGNTGPGMTMDWTLASGTGLADSGKWYGSNCYDINGDGALDLIAASWGLGVRAYLSNQNGPVITDDIAPAAVSDLTVTDVTTNTITVTWTAVGDDDNSGTASSYELRYAESLITSSNWNLAVKASNPPTPKDVGGAESYTFTGLDEATTYYLAVKTADEKPNWSPVSNSPSATTLGTAKPSLAVTLTPDKTIIDSGETIELSVNVQSKDELSPVSEASVELSTETTGLKIAPTSGQTDASGVLIASISAPYVSFDMDVVIQVKVQKTDYKTNYSSLTLNLKAVSSDQQFNLVIAESDIELSQDTIKAGDEITIFATISNSGLQDATSYTVKFYVNNKQLGGDKGYPQLKKGGTQDVSVLWTATEGTHTIKVEAVPADMVMESNSNDNSAEISVTVAGGDSGSSGDDKEGGLPQSYLIMIVVVVVIVILALVMILGKRKSGSSEKKPEKEDERVEDNNEP